MTDHLGTLPTQLRLKVESRASRPPPFPTEITKRPQYRIIVTPFFFPTHKHPVHLPKRLQDMMFS